MTYSRNTTCRKGLFQDCRSGWEGVLAIVAGIPLVVLLEMVQVVKIWRWSHQQYSLADCLIKMQDVINLGMMLVPFIAFASFYIFRFENRAEVIIKYGKRSNVWNQMIIKRVYLACMTSVYIIAADLFFGMLMCNRYINWNETKSLFAVENEGNTKKIAFSVVVLLCYVVYVLKLCFVFFIAALLKKKYVVLGVVLGIPSVEFFLRNVPVKLFYRLTDLEYSDWIYMGSILKGVLWLLFLCIVVWAIGMYQIKKRDFYG